MRSSTFMPTLAILLALGAIMGCSDDETASDRVCDAGAQLRDDFRSVINDVADGDLDEARDGLDEMQSDYEDLEAALGDLETEQREALAPEVDQLESDVVDLGDAESLDGVGSGIDAVLDSAETIVDDVAESLNCD